LLSIGGSLLVIGGVFTSIGSAEAIASSSFASRSLGKPIPLDLWGNVWFDLGIGSIVLGLFVLFVGALYLTPRFAGPKLKLVFGEGPEFTPALTVTEGMARMARERGSKVSNAYAVWIRVDEMRGVEAQNAHVRLASVKPPNPYVQTPELLPWRVNGDPRYWTVPAHGHEYVVLTTGVVLENDQILFMGPLVGLNQLDEPLEVELQGWRLRAGVNGSGRRLRADTTQPS
jgi:hypothetical protein